MEGRRDRTRVGRRSAAWIGWVVIGAAGCWGGRPARVAAPPVDPAAVQAAVFAAADADGDGRLVGAELKTIPAIFAARAGLDADRDGAVAAVELTQWLDAVRRSKVAIHRLELLVRRSGRPLAGMVVRLVPEAGMGGFIKPAEGMTDADGIAQMTIPGSPHTGVNCGLYRVAVGGEAASGTALGIAIGAGLPEEEPVVLDLALDEDAGGQRHR
jgi:hypothetical protein